MITTWKPVALIVNINDDYIRSFFGHLLPPQWLNKKYGQKGNQASRCFHYVFIFTNLDFESVYLKYLPEQPELARGSFLVLQIPKLVLANQISHSYKFRLHF